MIVYMLRRISTGLYFRKSVAQHLDWVAKGGEVWTDKRGPNSAKAKCKRLGVTDVEVVPFVLTEARDTTVIAMRHGSIVVVRGTEWMGVYVDGKLVGESHRFSALDLLHLLGFDYTFRDVNDEWLVEQEGLPEKLEDVVLDG